MKKSEIEYVKNKVKDAISEAIGELDVIRDQDENIDSIIRDLEEIQLNRL